MTAASIARTPAQIEIRVRGRVQGVGFRPFVWSLARELDLSGEVLNDSEGVLIRLKGEQPRIDGFLERLADAPPLAKIESVTQRAFMGDLPPVFLIRESMVSTARTDIAPDAAVCAACAGEIVDPFARRFRYPFTNCTHCGPRLTIVESVPYDRGRTAMAPFPLCAECLRDYENPADRRFHAEAIACHACGPKARLIRFDGRAISFDQHSLLDDVDAAGGLLQKGHIVAIKGLGGYQLACDATNAQAVRSLRETKLRAAKPFALMARDMDIVRRYCRPSEAEARALASPQGPIVLMRADGPDRLPDAVAPNLSTLGFMLPTTPLHLLILRRMNRPAVMTSGNLSDRPQIVDDDKAFATLGAVADYALVHNREILHRVDDSVVRAMGGRERLVRRARGYAPDAIALPPGFEKAPRVLAFGAELKSTFCLITQGGAVLSQHIGDLDNAETTDDYRKAQTLFATLFDHAPDVLAADAHPEYRAAKLARARANAEALPLVEVQHHHAHVAACLAENNRPLDAAPVLGIVLDGLGFGENGELWGGEFLLADYRASQRLATFKPVALIGGEQAMREPWRNLYAHLMAESGWPEFAMNFSALPLYADLEKRPRAVLDRMLEGNIHAPRASSCGRLFDAVAAALGLAREKQTYEGEAASRLEAIVDETALRQESDALAYPFTIPHLKGSGLPYIEPRAMWNALLGDLILNTPAPVIAARFHKGLAIALVAMAQKLAGEDRTRFSTVALSGGCFQNKILFEETSRRLEAERFTVLSHARVPANDGGIALGQAAVAAGRAIKRRSNEAPSCV